MKQTSQPAPKEKLTERAYLVGVSLPDSPLIIEKEHLGELQQLATTAGAVVVGQAIQGRTRIDGATFIGPGKAAEIKEECANLDANLIIFDRDLSPAQAANLEKILNINVIDRTELILDIFARHAKTQQAKTQVELAQLVYSLPRLRKLWDHLSRQQGGIGSRGPGEAQLEVDRRRVRERIGRLKKQLKTFDRRKDLLRRSRNAHAKVALVGYTNAGKSTLMNALTGANTLAENRLFATLDTLTRKIEKQDRPPIMLVDTVGFIRKLPHHLVESFKATLDDVTTADLCLHVVDLSHPAYLDQMHIADVTLASIKDERVKTVYVFNKIDSVDDSILDGLRHRYPDAEFISAAERSGLDALRRRVEQELFGKVMEVEVKIHAADGKGISAIKSLLQEVTDTFEDGFCVFTGRIKSKLMAHLESIDGAQVRFIF